MISHDIAISVYFIYLDSSDYLCSIKKIDAKYIRIRNSIVYIIQ